ncbi:MAG: hypothetical protein ABIG71_00625 [Candidatus Uhrbacteria bacterium]
MSILEMLGFGKKPPAEEEKDVVATEEEVTPVAPVEPIAPPMEATPAAPVEPIAPPAVEVPKVDEVKTPENSAAAE